MYVASVEKCYHFVQVDVCFFDVYLFYGEFCPGFIENIHGFRVNQQRFNFNIALLRFQHIETLMVLRDTCTAHLLTRKRQLQLFVLFLAQCAYMSLVATSFSS